MNRNSVVALLGVGLLGVGVVAGALLAASTIPRDDPLPVTTDIAPPELEAAGADLMPRPAPTYTRPPGLNARELEEDDVIPTRDELIAFARENAWMVSADPVEWGSWNALIVSCMAEKGFWYDPRMGMPTILASDEFRLALSGPGTGAADAYRWQDAGCGGWATHELGIGS